MKLTQLSKIINKRLTLTPPDSRLDKVVYQAMSEYDDDNINDKYHLMWRMRQISDHYANPEPITGSKLPSVITPDIASKILYEHMVYVYDWHENIRYSNFKEGSLVRQFMPNSPAENEAIVKYVRRCGIIGFSRLVIAIVAVCGWYYIFG